MDGVQISLTETVDISEVNHLVFTVDHKLKPVCTRCLPKLEGGVIGITAEKCVFCGENHENRTKNQLEFNF